MATRVRRWEGIEPSSLFSLNNVIP
jgi:hypothetical protein